MPIRPEFRPLYPANWAAISQSVRFERAKGRCEGCGRPHLARIDCLPDGRWRDPLTGAWRTGRGHQAAPPDLVELTRQRATKVVLAAAHRRHDPARSRPRDLKALCQRCHLAHDRDQHRWQRWLTWRRRYASGDLFLGNYEALRRQPGWPPTAGAPRPETARARADDGS